MIPTAAEKEKVDCPYCHTASTLYFPLNTRRYYRCPSCGLIFSGKRHANDNDAYYKNRYFDEYSGDQTSGQRNDLYAYVLGMLEKYHKRGTLLDVGCGCGHFLKEALLRGWDAAGVDPSEKSVAYARELTGDRVICGTLDDVPPDRKFDVVTMINVLDHLADPFRQLQTVHTILAPGGILYMRFPNGAFHSFMARLSMRVSSAKFINKFLVFHEYAFTPKAIAKILEDTEFTDVHVHNSPLTGGGFAIAGRLKELIGGVLKLIEKLTAGRWLWGPSLDIFAQKKL